MQKIPIALSFTFFISLLPSIILLLLLPCTESKTSGGNITSEFCPITNCSEKGPTIRFPFRLNTQLNFCGHEGFELSCSNKNTILHLPSSSSDYYVQEISYRDSTITIRDVQETTCAIQSLLSFNITNSKIFFFPFRSGKTLVNCTETVDIYGAIGPVECVSGDKIFVYVIDSDTSMDALPSTCRTYKSFDVSTEFDLLKALMRDSSTPEVVLGWKDSEYGCQGCEKSGDFCRFNIISNSTICLKQPHPQGPGVKIAVSTSTCIGGLFVLALVIFLVYRSRKSEQEKEIQVKVEKFLDDYRTLNPTRYTYSELRKITSKFKHRLGQGGYGSVFRGKLSNGIPVAVKMLENSKGKW
ncbi:hypothetical protein Pint_26910 [Pistacia integerrima]|uniref:Uncharacterized protein n=1 Tax=Pistacia integerrima TaxID=434235 RepID=A0ACC0YRT8_9ROSI|nr:hypothetical protein Pint_26910 [Pistacia integerrima]